MYRYYDVVLMIDGEESGIEFGSYLKSEAKFEVEEFNFNASEGEKLVIRERLTSEAPSPEVYSKQELKRIKKV